MEAKLIAKTEPALECIPNSEALISYCCRVSNESNQLNFETSLALVKYCIREKHWSVLEMVNVVIRVKTTRAISAQMLRHNFKVQELSQRYTPVDIEYPSFRAKGSTNRQGSLPDEVGEELNRIGMESINQSYEAYNFMVKNGVALESARMVLPMCTTTILYLNNDLRGWLHWIQVRTNEHSQKEHRDVAFACKAILEEAYPGVFKTMEDSK